MSKRLVFSVVAVLTLYFAGPVIAQETAGGDADDLAIKAANPIANLMSFPFQNNTDFGLGPYDRTVNVLNIQPVLPFADGKIITRTIMPVVWIPDFGAESGLDTWGLGDILATAWYVPSAGKVMWGAGAALEMPTGGSQRGSQKWSAGPSVVALYQPGKWTIGGLWNHIWSFAGDSDRDSVNKALINLFLVYQLGNGWYVNSGPIITADWTAESGQKWKVPVGAGFGRLVFLGKLPVNSQIGAYGYAVKPDFGPDWQLRLQIQVLLPKPG
jgi:hypothetical protein